MSQARIAPAVSRIEMLDPVTHESLSDRSIRHGFFTRQGGVSNGIYGDLNTGSGSRDDPANVAENRARVAQALGAEPNNLITVYQVHSPDVVTVTGQFPGERPKADAVVTATPGLALGVLTADCGPVLFADGKAGIVGAAHAGWRGAVSGILENTVAAMERLGSKRDDISAILGPTISRANYEVGGEFRDIFLKQEGGNERYFSASANAGHFMFDLPAYILDRLRRAGVRAEMTGHCTYAGETRFFSFRRTTHRGEPDYGRQISAIMISTDKG